MSLNTRGNDCLCCPSFFKKEIINSDITDDTQSKKEFEKAKTSIFDDDRGSCGMCCWDTAKTKIANFGKDGHCWKLLDGAVGPLDQYDRDVLE